MLFLDKLKTLFSGKFHFTYHSSDHSVTNTVKNNQGNVTITNYAPKEEKTIPLSQDEKNILWCLAEGGQIAILRDESGKIVKAAAFGNDLADTLEEDIILKNLSSLTRKSLITQSDNTHLKISDFGQKLVIELGQK